MHCSFELVLLLKWSHSKEHIFNIILDFQLKTLKFTTFSPPRQFFLFKDMKRHLYEYKKKPIELISFYCRSYFPSII